MSLVEADESIYWQQVDIRGMHRDSWETREGYKLGSILYVID